MQELNNVGESSFGEQAITIHGYKIVTYAFSIGEHRRPNHNIPEEERDNTENIERMKYNERPETRSMIDEDHRRQLDGMLLGGVR